MGKPYYIGCATLRDQAIDLYIPGTYQIEEVLEDGEIDFIAYLSFPIPKLACIPVEDLSQFPQLHLGIVYTFPTLHLPKPHWEGEVLCLGPLRISLV